MVMTSLDVHEHGDADSTASPLQPPWSLPGLVVLPLALFPPLASGAMVEGDLAQVGRT